jgi:hypothetical protein
MKWFKHLVDSGADPDIQEAVYLFGTDAYYVFFRTLEIMTREYNELTPGINEFLYEVYRKNYRVSSKKLIEILDFFHSKNRILIRTFDKNKHIYIRLECPKLRDMTEKTSTERVQRFRERQRLQETPETVSDVTMEPTEQRIKNKDKEQVQSTVEDSTGPAPDSDKKIYSEVIEILKELGVRGDDAFTMVSTGTAEFIFRKIMYLRFYQDNPGDNGQIKSPSGWIIRACEQNYSDPEGFTEWINDNLDSWLANPIFPECIKKELKYLAVGE